MKRFLVPIYGIRIFMSNNLEDTRRYFASHGGDPEDCEKALGLCNVFRDKRNDIHRVIAVFDGKQGTLAHECVHMSWIILQACAVRIGPDNHEAQATLVDWLITTFTRTFRKHR